MVGSMEAGERPNAIIPSRSIVSSQLSVISNNKEVDDLYCLLFTDY